MASIVSTPPPSTEDDNRIDDEMRTDTAIKAGTKQRISALEEEIQVLKAGVSKTKSTDSWVNQGRGIRCLVSLFDSISDMVAERDRRIYEQDDDEASTQPQDYSEDENRTFRGFKELVYYVPTLKKKLNEEVASNKELASIYKQLRKGSDGARGDDAGNMKPAAVQWLSELFPASSTTPLDPLDKSWRGFSHDLTGSLLCPSEYDWSNTSIKEQIRDRHPRYLVTANLWPTFVYANYKYDPKDIEKGLFQSTLLLKAYKFIFTAPSSARDVRADGPDPPPHLLYKRPRCELAESRTRGHLRFALSGVGSWRVEDGDFNYQQFYNNILDFFEMPPGPTSKAEIENLLLWWNRKVFGRSRAAVYSPQAVENTSVARLAAQRAAKENRSSRAS
ncbi:hypothetical protein SERLADRAFT_443536 [Serpula lacrymans var. lacrymans S7.9]|uniref:Uncharacterized protein n=1 Tax=Serpula lacrymans var. lacrymans (strain S7.9) TaxID=578457 RepID=F8PCP4_SERL9|nr:uncharacterized protein SERLADRAFT_443536 [Serpula lacrymans var. lacrymans S7.9]EGO18993.1 hypothetical protein SERLADRAFT_443536 [Serpula lacrymans var. lacrymans S7.9]